MGKLIKIIMAFAVILLVAFVVRTLYFKTSDISVEEIVERAGNQVEQTVKDSVNQAEKNMQEQLNK